MMGLSLDWESNFIVFIVVCRFFSNIKNKYTTNLKSVKQVLYLCNMKKKIVVDPDKVIKVEPRKVKTPTPMFVGFMYGWFSLYLILKLLGKI